MKNYERREILRLMGVGGVTLASGLVACAPGTTGPLPAAPGPAGTAGTGADSAAQQDFFFLQLSDTHWGFNGPAHPDAQKTLPAAVRAINASAVKPAFVMFTGDLTQTTDDPALRRARMKEFKSIIAELDVKDVRFIPGEHDAAPDAGEAFREFFGDTHYAFSHQGVRFIALDNVSDPSASLGAEQLAWLSREVAAAPKDAPLVVFAHRPLFDLFPAWDWNTTDGAQAIATLEQHPNVTAFYGHIHQQHQDRTGHVQHYAARSLVFPLPAPGSVPKKAPLPWDEASADHGLGYREVARDERALRVAEHALVQV